MRLMKHASFSLGEIGRMLSCVLSFCVLVHSNAETKNGIGLEEGEFKAAILSKIPPYITWPDRSLVDAETLVIGIFGREPAVEDLLKGLLKNRTVKGHACVTTNVSTAEEISKCHIVFIPKNENEHWRELSKAVPAAGILTVGESNDFIELGYVFNLNFPAKKKLEISLKNAKSAGLLIKPELLQLAKVIR
jgi:hypothetical protein